MSVLSSARRPLLALRAVLMTLILALACLASSAAPAFADPSTGDWAKLRMCESSGNYAINTGNGYYGAYQFNLATWEWMGGTGLPSDASPAEQDYRALKLYRINGWAPWPACTKKLGLKNDADAKSGVIPPDPGFASTPPTSTTVTTTTKKKKKKPTTSPAPPAPSTSLPSTTATPAPTTTTTAAPSTQAPPTTAPAKKAAKKTTKKTAAPKTTSASPTTVPATAARQIDDAPGRQAADPDAVPVEASVRDSAAHPWPGRRYLQGEYSEELKIWQRQAASLGYDVVPTGYFGPKTERAALDLQKRLGITIAGYIGPQTWSAAWTAPETTR